ncbi:hypothetical protein OQA88_13164 [Cercophora sp. LCS_1]
MDFQGLDIAIAQLVARKMGYKSILSDKASKEREETVQKFVKSCLDALCSHLKTYLEKLNQIATVLDRDINTAWELKEHSAPVIGEYERLRIDHWLASWLAITDEDTSSADKLPTTLDEVEELAWNKKLRFRKLNEELDAKRRECAMLTAEIFAKHAEVAARLCIPEIQSFFV